jgi:hypothetical protein
MTKVKEELNLTIPKKVIYKLNPDWIANGLL